MMLVVGVFSNVVGCIWKLWIAGIRRTEVFRIYVGCV